MCGRVVIARNSRDLQRIANAKNNMKNASRFQGGYNVAPGQYVPVVHCLGKGREREIEAMKWGFNHKTHDSLIFNSRSDTIEVYACYRDMHRCVIMIEGYYEWKKDDKGISHPHYITIDESDTTEGIIYLAGLCKEELDDDGFEIKSMTVITKDADKSIDSIHHRMPLILTDKQVHQYLNGSPINDFLGNNYQVKYHEVADLVNSFKNTGKDNILRKDLVNYNKNKNYVITKFLEKDGEKLIMKRSKSLKIIQSPSKTKTINHIKFMREKTAHSVDDSASIVTGSTEVSHIKGNHQRGKKIPASFISSQKKGKKMQSCNNKSITDFLSMNNAEKD